MKGIPFLVFDAGGVLEMFDAKQHKDNVVPEPTLTSLADKLTAVRLSRARLSPSLVLRFTPMLITFAHKSFHPHACQKLQAR